MPAVEELLSRLTLLSFSEDVAKKSGELLAYLKKEGIVLEFRDLFIGTIALVHGYSLKTYNLKHFTKLSGLSLFS